MYRTLPGNTFGLFIYTALLFFWRDAIAPGLREKVAGVVAIGWTLMLLCAGLIVRFPPAHATEFAVIFMSILTILVGIFIYNRVNYSFYP